MHITQHTQRSQTRLRHHSAYGLASLAAVALLTALASALGAAAQLPSPPPPAMPTPDEDGYQGSAVKHSTHAQTAHKSGLVKWVFSSPVPPRTRTSSPHLTSSTTKPGQNRSPPSLPDPTLVDHDDEDDTEVSATGSGDGGPCGPVGLAIAAAAGAAAMLVG